MRRRRGKKASSTARLEVWRPPAGAGDPIGCLTTTYTFTPGLFDEQCLGRFLEIESAPDREDLPFLLERETRLGGVYAGVLVDHTHAGQEHSLRWDVLPVRLPAGKQHAKISLIAWARCVRIIVASANLSEAGYRTNREVTASVDLKPEHADLAMLADALAFLRRLMRFVPGAEGDLPAAQRAEDFLTRVEQQTRGWNVLRRQADVRRHLVFTLPEGPAGEERASSLEDAIALCRKRGVSPGEAWIASPFFDLDEDESPLAAALCKLMTRKGGRSVTFCVPSIRGDDAPDVARLAAPRGLILTPPRYDTGVTVEALPDEDPDRNLRPWHAKMLALQANAYSALMIGSSNFTRAGMGIGPYRNAEANLVTIVDRVQFGRDAGLLEAIWPEMDHIENPESAEWVGAPPEPDGGPAESPPLPLGFLAATYRAGEHRRILVSLNPAGLPDHWAIHTCGQKAHPLIDDSGWRDAGRPKVVELEWEPVEPPVRLLVRWEDKEAFLPLNVEDAGELPPPAQTDGMSADDMLWILAATDPSAAFRAWARHQKSSGGDDDDLDTAEPVDLNPLNRYDLNATFLHRIRNRARILAQLRANLERPTWSAQALDWRLRGFIGIEALADRLVRDFENADGDSNEALLTLADFLIVLREVDYKPGDGGLPRERFEAVYRPFLSGLAADLDRRVDGRETRVSRDVLSFWNRVLGLCRE